MKENRLYFSYIKDDEVKFKAELNGIYYEYKGIDVKKIQELFDSADDFMSLCLYKELTYLLKAGIRPKDQPGYDMMAQMRMYLSAIDEDIDSSIFDRHKFMAAFCNHFNLQGKNHFELLEQINELTLSTINDYYINHPDFYMYGYHYDEAALKATKTVIEACLIQTGRVPYKRESYGINVDYERYYPYCNSYNVIPSGECTKTIYSWKWCLPFCKILL